MTKKTDKAEYSRPQITTFSMDAILQKLGPATAGYDISDQRFKKHIESLANAMRTVRQLRGVAYDWRTDEFPGRGFETGRDIGLIAQEVETVLPEIVVTKPDGYKAVQYAKLVAVLVEAVKELEVDKNDLRQEIDELKANQSRIARQLEELEALAAVNEP